MLRSFFLFVTALLGALMPISAHQVDTVELELQQLEGIWRLHGQMDIAYMLPETRWVPDAGALDRARLSRAGPSAIICAP